MSPCSCLSGADSEYQFEHVTVVAATTHRVVVVVAVEGLLSPDPELRRDIAPGETADINIFHSYFRVYLRVYPTLCRCNVRGKKLITKAIGNAILMKMEDSIILCRVL